MSTRRIQCLRDEFQGEVVESPDRFDPFITAALRRRISQMDPTAPTNSTPPPPVDRGTEWLTPQPQLEPQELNVHFPHTTRPHSATNSTTFPELSNPPVIIHIAEVEIEHSPAPRRIELTSVREVS